MQASIRIQCPHCHFSRDLPEEKVPDRPVRVTCPKCKRSFDFQKPPSLAPKLPAAISPSQQTDNRPAAPTRPLPAPPDASPAEQAPQQPPTVGLKRAQPLRVPRLLEVGELFGKAWDSYCRRWLLLSGLFLVAAAGAVLPLVMLSAGLAWLGKGGVTIDGNALLLLTALAGVAGFIAFFRGIAALIAAAVDESTGFRTALARGSSCWITLFWVSSLYGFIVGGASLLLVIPGILAGVWFFASPYLAVADDARGMEALLKSRAIVANRFWPVFMRLFLVWLLATVLGMIPFAGPVLVLAVAPFTILYQVILYRSLAESAGSTGSCTSGDKARWLLLGLAGYLLVTVVIVSIFGVSFVNSLLPFLKSGSLPAQGRQIITILPPSGEMPVGFSPESGADGLAAPPAGTGPTIEIGPAPDPATAGSPFQVTDLSVFIYAVNAPGTIRVNGQEFKTIKSEPDMQYNINAFGDQFRPGDNTIEFDVVPSPGDGSRLAPKIEMKVSMGGRVLGEWRLSAKDGWPRSVTVAIPAGQAP